MKAKRSASLDGLHAAITFPLVEGEGFSSGLKLKKCFRLGASLVRERPRRVSGVLRRGLMAGRVVAAFLDGSSSVLWADGAGAAVGVRRNFDRDSSLVNVTAEDGERGL